MSEAIKELTKFLNIAVRIDGNIYLNILLHIDEIMVFDLCFQKQTVKSLALHQLLGGLLINYLISCCDFFVYFFR